MNSVVGTKIKYYRCFSKSSTEIPTRKTAFITRKTSSPAGQNRQSRYQKDLFEKVN